MLEFESIVWPDDAEWLRIGVVFTGILALIGLTEGLRYVARFPSEVSRKFVHFAIGVGILFSPRLFLSPVPLILLSLVFIPINLLAVWKGWLPGIHGPDRRSFGTVYFPVSLLVLTVVFWQRSPELVALAMFSFAVGDAAAALVGCEPDVVPRPPGGQPLPARHGGEQQGNGFGFGHVPKSSGPVPRFCQTPGLRLSHGYRDRPRGAPPGAPASRARPRGAPRCRRE